MHYNPIYGTGRELLNERDDWKVSRQLTPMHTSTFSTSHHPGHLKRDGKWSLTPQKPTHTHQACPQPCNDGLVFIMHLLLGEAHTYRKQHCQVWEPKGYEPTISISGASARELIRCAEKTEGDRVLLCRVPDIRHGVSQEDNKNHG